MTWISLLRLVAALAVVFIHVAKISDAVLYSRAWWSASFFNLGSHWCVPVFVMISGALLLNPAKSYGIGEFYKKRLDKIIIPTVVWSCVYLGYSAYQYYCATHQVPVGRLLFSLFAGKPYYHLWYLYMLLPLYMLAPFIKIIVAHTTRAELGILTALLLSNAIGISVVGALGFYHSVPVWNSFFYYAAYLLLGYLISTTECRKYKPAALAVLVISVLTAVGGNYIVNRHISQTLSGYFSNYFSIPTIFAAISIMYFFKDMRIPDRYRTFINNVSGLTLGIYVIHPLFINLLRTFSPTLDQAKYPTLLIIVTAVGAFIFATGSSWIIARIPYVRRII